jgi:two-component system cell cycle sensor histidine kinase/response regulator CckA
MSVPIRPTNGHVEILIAQDSPAQAEQLKHMLEKQGHSVIVAANGMRALEAARAHRPTLIVSDIVMSDEMDGYVLCKSIKAEKDLKEVPVILMTSLSRAEDVVKGIDCGADFFIRKPYDESAFLSRVDYALSNRNLREPVKTDVSLQVQLGGKTHRVTAEARRILDLLISTYEDATRINAELGEKQKELVRLAAGLEREVEERTAALRAEFAERKVATEQLRQSEEQFRLIAENIGDLIAVLDLEGRRLYNSPSYKAILGDPTALRGSVSFNEIHPDDRERIRKIFAETVRTGRGQRAEYRFLLPDGSVRYIESQGSVIPDEKGKPAKVIVVSRDVTERRRHEEALVKLRLAVDTSGEVIFMTDRDGMFTSVNPEFTRLYGYTEDEVVGKVTPRILKSGSINPEDYANFWKRILEKQVVRWEVVNKTKDGRLITVENCASPILDEAGKIIGFLAIQRDNTERNHLGERLRQAEKMEAVGQLAGGVAHDFNNLLTIINGYSDILLAQISSDDKQRGHVMEILSAGKRAASLTRQLLAFSRRQTLAPVVLDLNAVVQNLDKMLRRLIGEDIDLVTVAGEVLWGVKADPSQIEQVMINLAVNARDAMPRGGKLTIETANVFLDENYAQAHANIEPGSYVMLAVSDTGAGMDSQTQARIFEPFFTTKGPDKGTGLGLSTVFGIVKQSGGHIWVYSELGVGTTFKIYLPRVKEPLEHAEPAIAQSDLCQGSETVLVVEDEEAVRILVRRVLESSGYRVLEARHGAEALVICDEHKEPLHLLMTDVIMPLMSGRQLAERVSSQRPEIKILFMSGYTDNAILHHGVLEPGTNFLQKPFTPNSVLHKVRAVLDGDPSAGSAPPQ